MIITSNTKLLVFLKYLNNTLKTIKLKIIVLTFNTIIVENHKITLLIIKILYNN